MQSKQTAKLRLQEIHKSERNSQNQRNIRFTTKLTNHTCINELKAEAYPAMHEAIVHTHFP